MPAPRCSGGDATCSFKNLRLKFGPRFAHGVHWTLSGLCKFPKIFISYLAVSYSQNPPRLSRGSSGFNLKNRDQTK